MNQLLADELVEASGEHDLHALLRVDYRLLFTFAPEPGSDDLKGPVDARAVDPRTGNTVRPFDLERIERGRGQPPSTATH